MAAVRPRPNALAWLAVSLAVIAFDQVTKEIALQALQPWQPREVIPGLLNWTLAFNPGAAFSFLAGASGWQRWFFTGLAVVICSVLVHWLSRTPRRDVWTALPLALIIGGAIGNVADRLRHGHVTDFIDVHFGGWSFPAFNIADSAITVGAVLLILGGLVQKRAVQEG